MKTTVKKIASVILCFAITAMIGSPAYAAYDRQVKSEQIESVMAEAVEEICEIQSKPTLTESEAQICSEVVCESEDIELVKQTEADANFEPSSDSNDGETETETIDSEKTSDIIAAVKEAVENADELTDEEKDIIEDAIEEGKAEIIPLTKSEELLLRAKYGVQPFVGAVEDIAAGLYFTLFIPIVPFIIIIPIVGITSLAIMAGPFIVVWGLVELVASPITGIIWFVSCDPSTGYYPFTPEEETEDEQENDFDITEESEQEEEIQLFD